MPFVFVGSAATAAGGLGLLAAPLGESRPARRAAVGGAVVELVASSWMRRRMRYVAQAYERGRPSVLLKASEALSVASAVGAVVGRRRRLPSKLAGVALLAGSALTRFAVFDAGVASAEDPSYTVRPQRERLESVTPRP